MRDFNARGGVPRSTHLQEPVPYRVSPLAAAVFAGITLLASGSAYAAGEKSVTELQAENARYQEENARLKAELEKARGATAAAVQPVQDIAPISAEPAAKTAAAKVDDAQTLDAVVVRSRARIERLQDVPLSVSVVTGKELERLGAVDVTTITKRAANVSWNQGNQRTSSLSIRGVGKIGQLEASDPSVGLIVDGVSLAFNPIVSSFNFVDIDTVEVTRGPQGTLLGKNSSLGVINVTTKRPSFTPSADYSVSIGQRDKVVGSFTAGGPIQEGVLAWRGSVTTEKGRGDFENVYAYDKDRTYTNTDRLTGRVQFLLVPNPDLTARFSLEATPNGGEYTNTRVYNTPTPSRYDNGAVNGPTNDDRVQRRWFSQNPAYYTYQRDYLSRSVIKVDGGYPLVTGNNAATAEVNWKLGDHTLTSVTAWRNYHFNAKNDEGTPFAISTTGGVHDKYTQVSQEFRLTSKPGGFVDYQTGLFLLHTKVSYTSFSNWLQDAGAWYASDAQYKTLDADGNGRYLLTNSVNGVFKKTINDIDNKSFAIFGQSNWHFTPQLTLTTGLRLTAEHRENPSSVSIIDNGVAAELNPVSVKSAAGTVQFGGFASSSSTGALLAGNTAAQLALADTVARKYFNKANYSALTSTELAQVAAAKALRNTQIGTVYNTVTPEAFSKIQPNFVISPSYKFSEDLTSYVSLQYGEKAGISQVVNGASKLAKAEKSTAYEIGFKSVWLNKTLVFNADLYLQNVKDYQQSVRELDPLASTPTSLAFVTYTGNAPKVRAQGLEVDGVYSGITNTTIRFSGAINDARYKSFPNSPQAAENANLTTPADLTGRTLAGASKVTWNVGVDWHKPVLGDKDFHVSFNTAYNSGYNNDVTLSRFAWIPPSYTTDISVGLGTVSKSFDISLLAKNAFNNRTSTTLTWNTIAPAAERWVGLVFTGKL